ncbi:hypothetical protein BGX38DRAFT_1155530, partial [Terfezia claveryi]
SFRWHTSQSIRHWEFHPKHKSRKPMNHEASNKCTHSRPISQHSVSDRASSVDLGLSRRSSKFGLNRQKHCRASDLSTAKPPFLVGTNVSTLLSFKTPTEEERSSFCVHGARYMCARCDSYCSVSLDLNVDDDVSTAEGFL